VSQTRLASSGYREAMAERLVNTRATATVRRIGLEWVGETEKYHHLCLQEYRLTPADLAAPGS